MSPPDNKAYKLWGNLATVQVTSGGCSVRGDPSEAWSPPGQPAISGVWFTEEFQMYLNTTNATPGGNCTVTLTPYIPDDASGALTPGTPRIMTFPILETP